MNTISICPLCGGEKENCPFLFCQDCVDGMESLAPAYGPPVCDVLMDQLSPSYGGTMEDPGFTMNIICHLCGGQKANSPSLFCQFCVNGWYNVVRTYGTPGCDVPMDQSCADCGGTVDGRGYCRNCNEADPHYIGCGDVTDAPGSLCQSCGDNFDHSVNSPDVRVRSPIVEGGQSDDEVMSEDGHDSFTFRQTGQRTFAKNAATQTTYKLNLHPDWENKRLEDILEDLHDVFREVITRVKSVSNENTDLANVIIHVPEFGDIVVPLRPLNRLTVDDIMKVVENALQSNQSLEVQNGFQVTIGVIRIPTGAGRNKRAIKCYTLSGPENAIDLKKSVITVTNDDNSCMYQAIAISWIKSLRAVSQNEWEELSPGYDLKDPTVQFQRMLELDVCSKRTTQEIRKSDRSSLRKRAAGFLCREAGVNYGTPGTLTDLPAFEASNREKDRGRVQLRWKPNHPCRGWGHDTDLSLSQGCRGKTG